MDAAGALGALGTLVGLVRALPQFVRLLRTRDAHGVSIDTAATSSIVSFGWATYGLLTDQLPVFLATGSSGVVFALITLVALRVGRRITELRAAPVWLVVLLVVVAVARADGLGVLLPISVLIANVPQLVVAYRETDLTGLSLSTWLLSMSDGAVWAAYAMITGDTAILAFGALQLGTSGAIVARRWAWGRTAGLTRQGHLLERTGHEKTDSEHVPHARWRHAGTRRTRGGHHRRLRSRRMVRELLGRQDGSGDGRRDE